MESSENTSREEKSVHINADQARVIANYDRHNWLRSITYGVAIISGIGSGVIKIWDMFYQNIKGSPIIQAAKDTRDKGKADIFDDAAKRKGTASAMKPSEFGKRMYGVEKEFSGTVDKEIFEHLGVESKNILGKVKGTYHRLVTFGPYTGVKLVFSTVFATAVAVSAFSLLNQRAEVRKNMEDLKNQLDSQENQRARA